MSFKDTVILLATLNFATALPMTAVAQETTLSSQAVAAKMAGTWLAKEGDIVIGFTFGDQGSIEMIEYGEVSHRGHYKINTEVSPWQIDIVWEMHGQTKALYSVFEMTIDDKLRMPSPKSSVDKRPTQVSSGLAFTKGAAPVSTAQKPASEVEIKAAMKKLAGSWNGEITITFGEDGSLQMSSNGVVKAKGVYTVDPAQNPMHMTWWPEGQGLDKTIYVLEGNKLKIADPSHRQRPTDFTSGGKEFTRSTASPAGAVPAAGADPQAKLLAKMAGTWRGEVLDTPVVITLTANGGFSMKMLKLSTGEVKINMETKPWQIDFIPADPAEKTTYAFFEILADGKMRMTLPITARTAKRSKFEDFEDAIFILTKGPEGK
jgi:uncharacterized protein (TIGR03067 family)